MSASAAIKWVLHFPRPFPALPGRGLFAAASVLLAVLALAWHPQLLPRAYYWAWMQLADIQGQTSGVGLPRYRTAVDARVVDGLSDNASGLSFNRHTGTLFAVINQPPRIVELTTEGELLRLVALRGVRDPEDIAHIQGELFALVDERDQQVVLVRVPAGIAELDLSTAPRLGVGIDLNGNKGLEGIAWDRERRRLLVVKEQSPLRVMQITGLLEALEGGPFDVQVTEWERGRFTGPFLRDLSAVAVHEPSGHLLLLSDESRLIVEYDADRTPLGMLALNAGQQGLARDVPQAEGVSFGPDGALYVLSEPNLFYRFDPR